MRILIAALVSLLALSGLLGTPRLVTPADSSTDHATSYLNGGGSDGGDDDDDDDDDEDFRAVG